MSNSTWKNEKTKLVASWIINTPEIYQSARNFAKENPFAMSSGLNAAQQLYGQQPMAAAPTPGLLRGTPSQEQPMQYAMQMPQVSLI